MHVLALLSPGVDPKRFPTVASYGRFGAALLTSSQDHHQQQQQQGESDKGELLRAWQDSPPKGGRKGKVGGDGVWGVWVGETQWVDVFQCIFGAFFGYVAAEARGYVAAEARGKNRQYSTHWIMLCLLHCCRDQYQHARMPICVCLPVRVLLPPGPVSSSSSKRPRQQQQAAAAAGCAICVPEPALCAHHAGPHCCCLQPPQGGTAEGGGSQQQGQLRGSLTHTRSTGRQDVRQK
jgi:hypothetical protein